MPRVMASLVEVGRVEGGVGGSLDSVLVLETELTVGVG